MVVVNWKDEFYGATTVTRDQFKDPALRRGGVVRFWELLIDGLILRLDGMSVAELTAWEMLADVHKQITSPNTHPNGQWVRQKLQWFCSEIRTRRRRRAIDMARVFQQARADPSAQIDAVSNLFALVFPMLCRRWIPTNFFDIDHPAWHSPQLMDYTVPPRGLDDVETTFLTKTLRSSEESERLDKVFDAVVSVAIDQLESANMSLGQTIIDHTRRYLDAAIREGKNGAGSWCKTRYPYVTENNVDGAVILDVIVSVRPYEMLDQGEALHTWTDVDMDGEFESAVQDDAALAAFGSVGKVNQEFVSAIYLDDFPGGIAYPVTGSGHGKFQLKDGSGWLASALALSHGLMGAMSGTPLEENGCSSIVATGVSIRRPSGALVGNVSHMREKSMRRCPPPWWDADLYVPLMAVPEAQEGQQAVDKAVETAILGSRSITGVANFGDAFKSWNPPEPQAWSKPSIWREILVAGVSISGVVALGLRLDITDTGRLLWAVFGVFLLGWGTTLTAERWASLRDARKFRPRRFEDFASWAFAITSIFTIATVGLTAHEPVRYLLRDALDFEILFVQLAATFSMIVARRT